MSELKNDHIFVPQGKGIAPKATPTSDSPKERDVMSEQDALDDLARVFPAMVCGDVQSMRQALIQAKGVSEPERTQFVRSRIMAVVNRLKSQGAVFGYPLVTDVSAHLFNFIQNRKSFNPTDLNVVENDLLILQNILWKKLKGDGGEMGRKILNQLV